MFLENFTQNAPPALHGSQLLSTLHQRTQEHRVPIEHLLNFGRLAELAATRARYFDLYDVAAPKITPITL